ncbi:GNAT family N-acetyltransferase [Acidaminobacter sp. JC074]|uniref:GNAT family N-acetyltransferase n=1 Tax=Acidaminobacter sp. JC074 TaxID=2530199 RepID=UPI001F0FF09C|nr:GNAT family N-acetyltransferase [Acidaminobacter sp. JC074]MCH4889712.1 GNAT family N-acetyltransferase [Acidaminobacter sp. JC074]
MEYKILTRQELEEHLDDFCDLYKKCFTAKIDRDIVRWRYLDNPYKDVLMSVAIDQGRLVSVYAAYPFEMFSENKIVMGALSINSMTDPDYIRRGLFTKLGLALYDHLKDKDYHMVLGFPNHLSNPSYETKLGWQVLSEIPTLELKLEYETSDDLWIKLDNEFKGVYKTQAFNQVQIHKTSKYLKWRYHDCPSSEYMNYVIDDGNCVRSYMVFKAYKDRINIVDYVYDDIASFKRLLQAVINYGQKNGYDYITTWSVLGTSDHVALEKRGFRLKEPIRYFGVRAFNGSEDYLYNYRNWLLQMGDDNDY